MNPAPRPFPMRRMGALLALAVLCLIAILSLTQCNLVTDKLTGPNRGRETSPGRCFRECNEQYRDSLEAERELHEENLEKCRGRDRHRDRDRGSGRNAAGHGDGDGDRDEGRGRHDEGDRVCIAIERARHEAAIARIQEGRRQCLAGCHHQGGGTGG